MSKNVYVYVVVEYATDEPSQIHGIFEKLGTAVQVASGINADEYYNYSTIRVLTCVLNNIEHPVAAYTSSGICLYDKIQDEAEAEEKLRKSTKTKAAC